MMSLAAAMTLAFGSIARSASAYDAIIQPIFRARCVECHGEKKQKAKLALHTWEALMRGSDAGLVVKQRQPNESELLKRMLLPLEDDEHMPPEETPQPSAAEIALLKAWIEAGATTTVTLAGLALPADLTRAAAELPAKLAAVEKARAQAEPRWEFNADDVAKARAPTAARVLELQQRFPGALTYESRTSAVLHFTAAGMGQTFGDTELTELMEIAAEIVLLDVAGTAITDAAASLWPRFERLRVLRAGFTAIGDATVAALSQLPQLEVLTLNDSRLSENCIPRLKKMAKLRSLRLGGTSAENPAQAAQLPLVPSARDFPPPAPVPPVTEEKKKTP